MTAIGQGQAEPEGVIFLPERGLTRTARAQVRMLSCFRRGRLLLVAALVTGRALPQGQFVPEPWPKSLDSLPLPVSVTRPHQKAA